MEECIEHLDAQKLDLISELPDELLHQILSFLDMRCVVQTSILGKRWRYLWTSLPFLNFNEDEYNRSILAVGGGQQKPYYKNFEEEEFYRLMAVGEGESKPDYKSFTDFLNRILRLRNGSNLSIQSFCLCCESCDQEYAIMHATACDTSIYFYRYKKISEFRALDLSKCFFYTQLDHYVGLPCLKVLHLKSVFLVGGENTDNFFTGCPVLETLIILDCAVMQTGKLNISAPQLKYLELGNLTTSALEFGVFNVHIYLKVTVSAPNLTSFRCTDLVSVEYSLVNVSSVVEADIDVEFPMRHFFTATNEKDRQIVIECLVGLCNVKSLRLSARLLEVVYEVYKARMKNLVTPFCNLRLLKLKTSLAISEVHAIAYLFETCPSVETLVLEMNKMLSESPAEEESTETKKKSLESNLSSECNVSFHHLKFVQMRDAIGSLNELEFLKFLLKNAIILETISVHFSKTGLLDHEMQRNFSEELVTFSESISAGVDISIV